MVDGIPAYDTFARRRIWLALDKIRKTRRLKWDQLASQIATHAGITFHTRYFARLRRGGLSNEMIHQVVITIDEKFISGFLTSVHASPVALPDISLLRSNFVYGGSQYLHWHRMPAQQLTTVLEQISLPDGIVFDPKATEIQLSRLSFAEDLYLYRLTSFEGSSPLLLAWLSNGDVTVNVGIPNILDRLLSKFKLSINSNNVIEFVLFYFDFLTKDEFRPILNVSSLNELNSDFEFGANTQEILSKNILAHVVEGKDKYTVKLLSSADGHLVNLSICVTSDGEITAIDQSLVCTLTPKTRGTKSSMLPGRLELSSHKNSRILQEFILSQLELSDTGRSFKKLCELYFVDFIIASGIRFDVSYRGSSRSIFIVTSHDTSEFDEHEIIQIVMQLRFADQEALGHVTPPMGKDMMEYATVAHGKNLDAMVYACKFISGIQTVSDKERYIAGLTPALKEFYIAYEEGVPREILFDIYVKS